MKTNYYNFKTKLGLSVSFMMLVSFGLKAQESCPEISFISASPANVCAGGNSQLQVTIGALNYEVSNIPFAPIAMESDVITLAAGGVVVDSVNYHGSSEYDDLDEASWSDLPIPFGFNFFGNTYHSFGLGTNGSVFLGSGEQVDGTGSTTSQGYGSSFPSSDNAVAPCIAGIYADLNFSYMGTINYFTTGTAPNRILVINYTGGQFYLSPEVDGDLDAVGSLTTQVLLYETSNVIEVHTTYSSGDNDAVQGIQNADGTLAYTVEGRNDDYWSVETADAYRFSPEASTYSWTPSGLLDDATIATPMASGITGTTTFYVTVTTGECTAYDSVTVFQESLSGVTDISSSAVCSGSDVQLFASGQGGGEPYSYSWTGPDHFSSTDRNPIIDSALASSEGTYTVSITDGCETSPVEYTVSLVINPLPVVNITSPTTICVQSAPIALTATPEGGAFDGPGVTGVNTFSPSAAGIGMSEITYTVTDTNLCTGSGFQLIAIEDCTGIAENSLSQNVNMYPNPTNGMFNIEIQNTNFSALTISIIDPQGKEVYSVSDKNVSSNYKQQINIENLAKGIYFIKLSTDNAVAVKKLTLQ